MHPARAPEAPRPTTPGSAPSLPAADASTPSAEPGGHPLPRARTWVLGRVAGCEIVVHRAWLLGLLVAGAALGSWIFPAFVPGWGPSTYLKMGLLAAVAEHLAGVLHEFAHALAATAYGRRVHSLTLLPLGGRTTRDGGSSACETCLIAVAGPLINLSLAAALVATLDLLPNEALPLRAVWAFAALSNGLQGLVNLLPFLPLDGGRAYQAVRARAVAMDRVRPR